MCLARAYDGVNVVAHCSPIPLGNETAALLAAGDDALLSHLTAGGVWEMIRLPDGSVVHVIARRQRRNRDGIVVHRSRTLTREDIRIHHGLPVTSPARTLLDISEVLSTREVERALEEALARKLVTLDELRRLLARTKNRRGLTILRRLISWRRTSDGSRTKWQRTAYKAFVAAGLPEPEQDVWWLGYQHDFLWRAHRVTLEIDGYPRGIRRRPTWSASRQGSEGQAGRRRSKPGQQHPGRAEDLRGGCAGGGAARAPRPGMARAT